jgi:hypothetical protein
MNDHIKASITMKKPAAHSPSGLLPAYLVLKMRIFLEPSFHFSSNEAQAFWVRIVEANEHKPLVEVPHKRMHSTEHVAVKITEAASRNSSHSARPAATATATVVAASNSR